MLIDIIRLRTAIDPESGAGAMEPSHMAADEHMTFSESEYIFLFYFSF